jgi:hypothetical protein
LIAKIPHIKRSKKGRIFHPAVKEEAEKAISGLNGKDLKGRPLTVSEARPRTDRPRTGGGGFGGGRS